MKRLFIFLLGCFVCTCACAQRTVDRQFFLQGQYVFLDGWSARLGVGQYRSNGYWYADAGYLQEKTDDKTVGAVGGYDWRLISTRDRVLNVYGGVGGGAGYFWNADGDAFRYGLYPRLAVELFPLGKVALTGTFSVPYNMITSSGATTGAFSFKLGVGLRILL